jgi:hypothetical protein
MRLVGFYEGLGFRETFRTPEEGTPIHVGVTLDGFTIGTQMPTLREPITACARA